MPFLSLLLLYILDIYKHNFVVQLDATQCKINKKTLHIIVYVYA